MPRGGNRKHPADCKCGNCPKLGRKKLKPEAVADGDKNFAGRVLRRIGKPGWRDYADVTKVQSDEDYALHLLATTAGYDQFNKLLDRRFGKPVQTVNHLHDKPIEVNMNHSLSERFRLALEKAEKRVHAGR
jgi:hypothetical protein